MQFTKPFATVCAVALAAASAPADERTPREPIESVLVIGKHRRADADALAGSVDVIGRDELEYEHVDDTMELFSKVPGVALSRFNQGIINTDISIRGFAADGESPHAKLLIDGIPANLHNGFSEMDQLFPLAIDSIQVFKGTSDVRYGLFNLAGNYQIETRSDPGTKVELTVGSFDTVEGQGYFGLETGRLRHSYFLGFRQTDGFRDNTDLRKRGGSARWFYDVDDSATLGLIVRLADYGGDAPGYLGRDVRRRRPRSSAAFASEDGGDKDTRHFSLHFDKSFGRELEGSLRLYHQTFERERFVRFSEAGSLQNRFDDQAQDGAIATLRWRPSEEWALSVGADYEAQDNVEQRFGTIGQRRERDATNVLRDFAYTLRTVGGFASVEHVPNEVLRWNVGVRVDRLDGNFSQRDAMGVRTGRDIFDFGTLVQPKVNLFVSPADAVTLFAGYGRSFQHPFGASLYTAGDTRGRDVSINDGFEAGVKWQPLDTVEIRASYWEQNASDEFVLVDGTSRNVGKTERRGIDVAANWFVTDALYLFANYGWIDSEIRRPGSGREATIGNDLRSIPDFSASFGATYAIRPDLTLRVHADSQGDYDVNEANAGGRFGRYTVVYAALDYDTGWGSVSLQVNNLLDRQYEYVFDFSANGTDTIHSPGDGINASLSVSYRFQ